jgi:hypothetical protein
MATKSTNGQTTPKAPGLGRASSKKGSANVAKARVQRVSDGKMAKGKGVKLGTSYGKHNVGHPIGH